MKNKTHLPQLLALLCGVIILLLALAACNNDKDDDYEFGIYDEDNDITLYYPMGLNSSNFVVKGGESPFDVTSSSDILDATYLPLQNYLYLSANNAGQAQVKVTDAKGKSFTLNVTIKFTEREFRVINHEIVVQADKLDEAVKEEIREKALATLPVKPGGTYKMAYTGNSGGKAYFYPERQSSTRYEGTFEVGGSTPGFWDISAELPMYTFKVGDQEYNFISTIYRQDRSSVAPWAFYEDLKERFIKEYPEVEQVYTIQEVSDITEWNY